ncbi:MAG: site-specific tyrosine recombinase XerD [Ruminococcaceae bacterium]|nr:site-specific tyrosine recombinase XerD [Oscillospiraceae bacterium]
MELILEEYRNFLLNSKGCSQNTTLSYLHDLTAFCSTMDNDEDRICGADSDVLQSYLERLKASGKSNATLARTIASLRCFYQFLGEMLSLGTNPADYVRIDRTEKKLPNVLNAEEVNRLLSAPDVSTPKGLRDRAILELIYATGIRVSELCALNVEDLDVDASLLVCGGENRRVIPVYRMAMEAVNTYLDRVRGRLIDAKDNALFTNLNGGRLTRQGFWKIVKQYAAEAGIKAELTPHTLRHSFGAHLIENGADIADIQQMMGYAHPSSAAVYKKIADNKMKEAYNRYHPRAGGKKRKR